MRRSPGRALLGFAIFNFHFAIFNLSSPAHAVQFPDTTELKKTYKVAARKDGRPTAFFRKVGGDSASLLLEWAGKEITAARIEQSVEFDPDSFSVLNAEYGNGAAWHETMASRDPITTKTYPGLQQEWHLKGYGGEKGWLGSGLEKGRFFLVFRSSPPAAATAIAGPLRIQGNVFAFLDTSSRWLHVPCAGEKAASGTKTKGKNPGAPACFSPEDDSRLLVRIDRKKPVAFQAWLEEGESGALNDIKKALKSVPDAAQAEYAKDLSQMLMGEAQMFMVKLAQRLPEAFTWPSWQIQDFKGGQVPATEFLPIVRRQANTGDSLPAFRYEDAGIRLAVNLYYRGRFHLNAEAK
jgi:hypothetical protein